MVTGDLVGGSGGEETEEAVAAWAKQGGSRKASSLIPM
jgi:hypothetical protein